jgi:hypothetical protein
MTIEVTGHAENVSVLTGARTGWCAKCMEDWPCEMIRLRAESRRLRGALQFYADRKHLERRYTSEYSDPPDAPYWRVLDEGQTAQGALEGANDDHETIL